MVEELEELEELDGDDGELGGEGNGKRPGIQAELRSTLRMVTTRVSIGDMTLMLILTLITDLLCLVTLGSLPDSLRLTAYQAPGHVSVMRRPRLPWHGQCHGREQDKDRPSTVLATHPPNFFSYTYFSACPNLSSKRI